MSDLRCNITKNPCGTDTWTEGQPCLCKNCQSYLQQYPDERFPVGLVCHSSGETCGSDDWIIGDNCQCSACQEFIKNILNTGAANLLARQSQLLGWYDKPKDLDCKH